MMDIRGLKLAQSLCMAALAAKTGQVRGTKFRFVRHVPTPATDRQLHDWATNTLGLDRDPAGADVSLDEGCYQYVPL